MKTFIGFIVVICVLSVVMGCGHEIPQAPETTGTADPNIAPTARVAPVGIVSTPTPTPLPVVSIQVFSRTEVRAPQAGFPAKQYTSTGYCTQYQGATYCWDDGIKTIVISGFNFYYTYFNASKDAVGWSIAGGGLQADLMLEPTVLDPLGGLTVNLGAPIVNGVLSSGVSVNVDCTDTAGVLDCGTFSIDTLQTAL